MGHVTLLAAFDQRVEEVRKEKLPTGAKLLWEVNGNYYAPKSNLVRGQHRLALAACYLPLADSCSNWLVEESHWLQSAPMGRPSDGSMAFPHEAWETA